VASAVRRSCGAITSRSARPGHNPVADTVTPLTCAAVERAKRPMTSVEMRLR
jgi:hypothetical protein